MIKKKKKKNRIILCICSIFLLVASIFSFIPFVTNETKPVYADTVSSNYSFTGSNISSKTTFLKSDFMQNLIDNSLFVSGDLTSGGSAESPSESVIRTSNFIQVLPNTDYFITAGTNVISCSVKFYLSNTLSSSTGIFVEYTSASLPGFFTTPTGCNYVRIASRIIDTSNLTNNDFFMSYGNNADYNSTQVNYQFKFASENFIDDNNLYVDGMLYYKVESSDFVFAGYLGPNDDVIINNDGFFEYERGLGGFNADEWNSVGQIYFSPYNISTNTFNYDYRFEVCFSFDYVSTYNPETPFNSDIRYVVIGSYKDAASYFHISSDTLYFALDLFRNNGRYNFISYVDANGNNLNFFIPLESNCESDYFTYRKYYYASDDITSSSYSAGYRSGYSAGEKAGYDAGYKVGNNFGYNAGYSDGYAETHSYTFLDLVSSTIDAPMTYFQSLFNFELLGVNLQGFLMALFTLCVVVTIVRLCLGK